MQRTNPAIALVIATAIVQRVVPSARCELRDYGFYIGCADMDEWGTIQEVRFLADATQNEILHHAQVLFVKLTTGGSTAG